MSSETRLSTRLLGLLAVLMLTVMACCPTPTETLQETSFAATVEASDEGLLRVRLNDGTLALVQVGPNAQHEVGDRLYVEGVFSEGRVVARRITGVNSAPAGTT